MTFSLGPVRAAWTERVDGDLCPDTANGDAGAALAAWVERWAGGVDAPPRGTVRRVHTAVQVHGREVIEVDEAGSQPGLAHPRSPTSPVAPVRHGEADVLVTSTPAEAVAVLAADCGTVVLASPEGHAAAVHCGWPGLVAGTLVAGADALWRRGASRVMGAFGPCIHASCYEFSPDDVDRVAAVVGPTVRATTAAGRPALDLPAGLGAALAAAGVEVLPGLDRCTACSPASAASGSGAAYYSHRARADVGRQALVVWTGGPPTRRVPGRPTGRDDGVTG